MVVVLSEKSLVVQSNKLIEAKYRLSVEEQKIVKILVSQIRKDDTDFKDYEFRIKDLAEMLEMKYDNPYVVIRGITRRLMTRVLEFENPETNTLLQTTWLSSALYKKGEGTVSLHFDPLLKPLLLHLQSCFTKYELGQIMQFKGQYSIRFFELRKSFLGRHKKEVIFSLKDLWEMLGLKKNEYKVFKNFKNRVLEPARIELLEKTGKAFAWETIKQGRGGKIIGVRFVFDGEVQTAPVEELPRATKTPQEEPRQLALVTESEPTTPEGEAVAQLVGTGVSAKTAQVLTAQHGAEKVREKLEMLEGAKDIKNPAGFVAKALREDWHDEKANKQKQKLDEFAEQQRISIRKRELGELKKKYQKMENNILDEAYQKLSEEEKKEIQDTFAERQKGFYGIAAKLGFKGHAFQSLLVERFGHLVPGWKEFLQNEGVELSGKDVDLLKEV